MCINQFGVIFDHFARINVLPVIPKIGKLYLSRERVLFFFFSSYCSTFFPEPRKLTVGEKNFSGEGLGGDYAEGMFSPEDE